MNTRRFVLTLALFTGLWSTAAAARFTQPDAANHPDLFTWTDTCNVHELR